MIWPGTIGLLLFALAFWWITSPGVLEKLRAKGAKVPPILDRKARFKLYIEGEEQLMAEWEEAFDPVGTAFAKDIAIEMRQAKDNAWLFGSPYKAVSTGVYADPRGYSMIPSPGSMPPAPKPLNPYMSSYSDPNLTWNEYVNTIIRGPHA